MGWIVAFILGILLVSARAELKRLRRRAQSEPPTPGPAPEGGTSLPVVGELAVLRLQLRQMEAAGDLDEQTWRRLGDQIDVQWRATLAGAGIVPESPIWTERCNTAWRTLAAHGRAPFGPAPWERSAATKQLALGLESATAPAPGLSAPPQRTAPLPEVRATPHPPPPPSLPADETGVSHAWEPSPPGALERALRAASGWPRAVMPFLVQNIGWFIGGFLFLAGSVFLVAYTTGFTKGLVVFAALFAYTVGLLWGGYQLRLRQPALRAGSAMLMTLGLLLAPLTLSAAARLMLSGAQSFRLGVLGVVAAVSALGVFLFAAQVVSGVVDRALRGTHARVFLGLSAVQLALPLVDRWPLWPVLAVLHLSLLGLLAYGLLRYGREWMHSIFVERRAVAYFAGGTLVYAALVSFVHLTWGAASPSLPAGYYAPYLMALCGLLFYLDAQFKQWVHRHAFLSRFSFLVYGLSVLAVALALDAPVARAVTLALGAGVYAAVAWRYLTLPPVFLLLASLGGLYALLVLQPFPADRHFLWALPGIAGMAALCRWTQHLAAARPGAYPVAAVAYRVLVGLVFGLAAWSLSHAHPGWMAMTTGLTAAAIVWRLFASAPAPLLGSLELRDGVAATRPAALDLRNGPWLYALPLMLTAAAAYAPPWVHLDWGWRLAFSLVLLAWLWAWLAVPSPRRRTNLARVEVYANSALLSIGAGLTLALAPAAPGSAGLLALLFAAGAAALLWLSLSFQVRWLFYGFLILAAAAAVLIKLALFPGPSTGLAALTGGVGVWWLLWWLDRRADELEILGAHRLPRPLTLLWRFPAEGARPGPGHV
jgi:hypothetical protein